MPGALVEPAAGAGSASVEIGLEPSAPVAHGDLGALLDRLAAGMPEPSLGDDARFEPPAGRYP